jgi:hypothetical protein
MPFVEKWTLESGGRDRRMSQEMSFPNNHRGSKNKTADRSRVSREFMMKHKAQARWGINASSE